MKTLFVGGFFDDNGGKPSSQAIPVLSYPIKPKTRFLNGGYFSDLEKEIERIHEYDVIYWFANVPNDKPKIVNEIKKRHKKCLLVTSKRNDNDKYSLAEIINHGLKIKSNLIVEFKKNKDHIVARVLDPLSNIFIDFTKELLVVGKVIMKRINQLLTYTRIGSTRNGEKIEIPDKPEFFDLIKDYATVFHELIHHVPEATNRFFGNATFRCERGFPSFKEGDVVFVSKRNMDKRYVDKDSFVAVKANSFPIKFYADDGIKPSVDTPIQLKLYDYYPKILYMIHSHAYIKDALMTKNVISCGAIQEADDIKEVFPSRNEGKIFVNLRGHGSLAMVSDISMLKNIPYIPMDIAYVHDDFAKEIILNLEKL